MTRTVFYTATTLDGCIADPDDSLDWLLRQPQEEGGAGDYAEFIGGVGALVMGSTTYAWVLAHEQGVWPYTLPAFVLTHRELPLPASAASGEPADVRFRSGAVVDMLAELRGAAGAKDLWIVGGGDLAGQFADIGALDETVVSIAPVVLGAGRPLLPRRLDLELLEVGRNGSFVVARHRVIGALAEDRENG
ncbi:dihydrofolate reductase family protein [Leucobacter chromiiresistens]|uniref:Deaminase n=1 Tax=Leucobacter chromiiresistens TaxID=1079994 RepID=A0A147EM18_9MICO|nr:dihydrofolate reductase family protein [Leucobacter chromiiresistens]KTR85458.1 deaminase [Leucobacter chromiiresistens]